MRKIELGKLPSGENIEWYIAEENEKTVVLFSVYGLLNRPFTAHFRRSVYEDSDLKLWLETDFLEKCFEADIRKNCVNAGVPNIEQIMKWMPMEGTRRCEPSRYALANGASVYRCADGLESCTYWLTDPGRKQEFSVSIVLGNGKIYKSAFTGSKNICVRPYVVFLREWLDEYNRNNSW